MYLHTLTEHYKMLRINLYQIDVTLMFGNQLFLDVSMTFATFVELKQTSGLEDGGLDVQHLHLNLKNFGQFFSCLMKFLCSWTLLKVLQVARWCGLPQQTDIVC